MLRFPAPGVLCSVLLAAPAGAKARAATRQPARTYTIAFKSFAPNNSDVFIASADGSDARPLAPDPALGYDAPDGAGRRAQQPNAGK